MKISKKLKKEMAIITDFVNMTNSELDRREAEAATYNLEEETGYVRVGNSVGK